MLLHLVGWPGIDYKSVFESYISYIQTNFRSNDVIVVFDGYDTNSRIKSVERNRRYSKSADVQFTDDMMSDNFKRKISFK